MFYILEGSDLVRVLWGGKVKQSESHSWHKMVSGRLIIDLNYCTLIWPGAEGIPSHSDKL